ncbi:multiple epidermal growth factor-like domains protein 9 [Brienomyrus brachyistius]|uniref:multiple epidermal growth factor-like domains protein 9 n=1 Tax=Brienomyrus brachyistius TaxID=42636 RepID=UPI0020B1E7A9|nr:multiple epidermal growth factor-like domains protein 9 [Brienomyrus brachyistius]
MTVFLVVELALLLCSAGTAQPAPSASASPEAPAGRSPRSPSELINATMLNHLPEDKVGVELAALLRSAGPDTGSAPSTAAAPGVPEAATRITGKPVARSASVASSAVTAPATEAAPDITANAASLRSAAFSTKSRQAEVPCNCSGEGALDPDDCDRDTGQCACLPGYSGTQCDVCEDGHFNNGSTGCLPCACDSFGAVDHRCDSSGACTCKVGVYGPQCDECHPGFYHFSNTGCQPCQCHNHSSYCHPQSGICLDCQGNTQGSSCEECRPRFYRPPDVSPSDDCEPCPCSSIASTGTCHVGLDGLPACDQCHAGYAGTTCGRCSDSFYGTSGSCRPCDCSGNADPATAPRLCHPDTGSCLSCANNTAGVHCELCAPGYAGNALGGGCMLAARSPPTPPPRTTTIVTTTAPVAPAASPSDRQGGASRSNSSDSSGPLMPTLLGGTVDNSTATIAVVTWAQFNVIILAVIVATVALLMGAAAAVYAYREYQNRKLNAPFWTIELKEDNISFSSYHDSLPNADVSGLLEDEAGQAAPNGQLALSSPASVYKV